MRQPSNGATAWASMATTFHRCHLCANRRNEIICPHRIFIAAISNDSQFDLIYANAVTQEPTQHCNEIKLNLLSSVDKLILRSTIKWIHVRINQYALYISNFGIENIPTHAALAELKALFRTISVEVNISIDFEFDCEILYNIVNESICKYRNWTTIFPINL